MIVFSQTLRSENLYENMEKICSQGFSIELMLKADFVDALSQPEMMDTLSGKSKDNVISVHAVSHSLNIGSKDKTIRSYSERRLMESLEIGKRLNVKEFLFHSTLMPYLPLDEYLHWLEIASEVFTKIVNGCKSEGIIPVIENTYEKDAELFLTLFHEYPDIMFCLDTGHVNCFSHIELDEWLVKTLHKIRVIHLHDNNEQEDNHLNLCEGTIVFHKLLHVIRDLKEIRLNLETPIDNFFKNSEKLKELIANGIESKTRK